MIGPYELELIPIAEQMPEQAPERARSRLAAGVQEGPQERGDFLVAHFRAVGELGAAQRADHVVARLFVPQCHVLGNQVFDALRACDRDIELRPVQEQPDGPLVDLAQILGGEPEDVVDHRDRVRVAEVPHQLRASAGDVFVAQPGVDERLGDLVLPTAHRPLREGGLDDLPVDDMLGRVQRVDRPGAHRLHAAAVVHLAGEVLGIHQRATRLLEAEDGDRRAFGPRGQHRTAEAQVVDERVSLVDRALREQFGQPRVRVDDPVADLLLECGVQVDALQQVSHRHRSLLRLQ